MDTDDRLPENKTQGENPQEVSSRPPEAPTDPSSVRSLESTYLLLVEQDPDCYVPLSNHPRRLAGIRLAARKRQSLRQRSSISSRIATRACQAAGMPDLP